MRTLDSLINSAVYKMFACSTAEDSNYIRTLLTWHVLKTLCMSAILNLSEVSAKAVFHLLIILYKRVCSVPRWR